MSDAPPFYLVWRQGGGSPVVKHAHRDTAEREAEKLTRANPGEVFFVLAPVTRFVRSDIVRSTFDPGFDEIPF